MRILFIIQLFFFLFGVVSPASAQFVRPNIFKGCRSVLDGNPQMFPTIKVKVRIFSHGPNQYSVRLSSRIDGQERDEVQIHPVTITEATFAPELSIKKIEELNLSQLSVSDKLLLQRRYIDVDSANSGFTQSRLDWSQVRKAKIYLFEDGTLVPLGLVEAKDAAGNVLDTFLGGSMTGLCR